MLTSNIAAIDELWRTRRKKNRSYALSIIVDSEFTDTNKALNFLLQSLNRSGKIFSMIHKRLYCNKTSTFCHSSERKCSLHVDSLSSSFSIFISNKAQNFLSQQRNVLQTKWNDQQWSTMTWAWDKEKIWVSDRNWTHFFFVPCTLVSLLIISPFTFNLPSWKFTITFIYHNHDDIDTVD